MAHEAECPKTECVGRFSFCGRLDVVRLLEDASRMPISAMSGINAYRENFRNRLAKERPTRLFVSDDDEALQAAQIHGSACRIPIAASERTRIAGRGLRSAKDSICA